MPADPKQVFNDIQAESDKGLTVETSEIITAPLTVPGVSRPLVTRHFSTNYGQAVREIIDYRNKPDSSKWADELCRRYFDAEAYP